MFVKEYIRKKVKEEIKKTTDLIGQTEELIEKTSKKIGEIVLIKDEDWKKLHRRKVLRQRREIRVSQDLIGINTCVSEEFYKIRREVTYATSITINMLPHFEPLLVHTVPSSWQLMKTQSIRDLADKLLELSKLQQHDRNHLEELESLLRELEK